MGEVLSPEFLRGISEGQKVEDIIIEDIEYKNTSYNLWYPVNAIETCRNKNAVKIITRNLGGYCGGKREIRYPIRNRDVRVRRVDETNAPGPGKCLVCSGERMIALTAAVI